MTKLEKINKILKLEQYIDLGRDVLELFIDNIPTEEDEKINELATFDNYLLLIEIYSYLKLQYFEEKKDYICNLVDIVDDYNEIFQLPLSRIDYVKGVCEGSLI